MAEIGAKQIKQIMCIAYCKHLDDGSDACKNCDENPALTSNFELSDNARIMIQEGALTADGGTNLACRLNTSRINRIASIFGYSVSVDCRVKPDTDGTGGTGVVVKAL